MISVIVPVYNAEGFVAQTLETVLAQTYPYWELVIVNDGSRDRTQGIVEAFAARDNRVRVFTQENGGVAAARNFGFAQTHPASDYIIFLDHDDLWKPEALATLYKTAQAVPDAVAVVGGASVLPTDEAAAIHVRLQSRAMSSIADHELANNTAPSPSAGGNSSSLLPSFQSSDTAALLHFEELLSFCAIWTMGQTLIRRHALEAVGPLDPACVPSDDWDLYLRLLLLGPFAISSKIIIHWRQHASNTSNDKTRMQAAEKRVRAKLLARNNLTPAQRSLAIRHFRHPQRNLSAAQFQSARECLTRRQFREALLQFRRACLNYIRSLRSEQADIEK